MKPKNVVLISDTAWKLLKDNNWDSESLSIADIILQISNILYNNTSISVLPLDDGVYDQLIVAYSKYDPNYRVGAPPIQFKEVFNKEYNTEKKLMYHTVTDAEKEKKLYTNDILNQHTPMSDKMRPRTMYTLVQEPITKRLINTTHKYPELVGTLDKCKFVLNHDASQAEVFDNPSVQVFERDFIHPCLSSGLIHPDTKFEMIGELKYDGISVEAEVCGDRIVTALSRGDTADNIATDLTPILKGYKFYNASTVPKDQLFGIKFEAIITNRDLEILGKIRGKEYKNGRNAIIGLFGASDAYRFIDYITLIPLSTSLDMDRKTELYFLNKYYNCGQYNRFCVFNGNYQEILFQVKQFTESAELIRSVLPYMIDGVVISFTDENIIRALGRVNSVNKYQIAIKFNPREVRTIFYEYTYSIGKSGEVIPMVHFKSAEFMGTIHTKQTIHSFQRFKELSLIKGQEIDVKYVNDVISYVTKPDTEFNRHLEATGKPEEFIEYCPFCGSKIEISDTMKSARCPNVRCPERCVMRMTDMLDKLGFKDFSEMTVRALDMLTFKDLVTPYNYEEIRDIIGPATANSLISKQNELLNNQIQDYKIMAALSFEGMAEEKWKRILSVYTLSHLFSMNEFDIRASLSEINGIGPGIINSVIEGFNNYKEDVEFILNNFNLIETKHQAKKPKVALTGFRNDAFVQKVNELGFDCNDKYGVTKDIAILITNDYYSSSSKMAKAKKYGIEILTILDFAKRYNMSL